MIQVAASGNIDWIQVWRFLVGVNVLGGLRLTTSGSYLIVWWIHFIESIVLLVLTHLLWLTSCCSCIFLAVAVKTCLLCSFYKIKNKRNLNIWVFGIKEANVSVIPQFKWFMFNALLLPELLKLTVHIFSYFPKRITTKCLNRENNIVFGERYDAEETNHSWCYNRRCGIIYDVHTKYSWWIPMRYLVVVVVVVLNLWIYGTLLSFHRQHRKINVPISPSVVK